MEEEDCPVCPNDEEAASYPPPKWEFQMVDGTRKRCCQWKFDDGSVCGKPICGSKTRFDAHWRTHSGDKPFSCSHPGCNKAFARFYTLERHMRTHSGDKPYACAICDKAFRQAGHLQTHVRGKHHDELARPCKGGPPKSGDANAKCPLGLNGMHKYDNRCVRCFIAAFPNDPRAINAKAWLNAKEQTVRAFLETAFPGYRWTFDRSCAVGQPLVKQVRPDARVVVSHKRLLIVEIDEHSHDTYECADERMREQIIKEHAPRNAIVHVIRFNPDAYDCPITKVRIPSCFKYSKVKARVSVHPDRAADWAARLETLRATIQEIIDHQHEDICIPECLLMEDRYKFVIPIELFYDNVIEKWPDGHEQRLAAYKRNAELRKKLEEEEKAAPQAPPAKRSLPPTGKPRNGKARALPPTTNPLYPSDSDSEFD